MKKYYYRINHDWKGPITLFQIIGLFFDNKISLNTEIWTRNWCPSEKKPEHPDACIHQETKLNLSKTRSSSMRLLLFPFTVLSKFISIPNGKWIKVLIFGGFSLFSVSIISVVLVKVNLSLVKHNHKSYHVHSSSDVVEFIEELKRKDKVDNTTKLEVKVDVRPEFHFFSTQVLIKKEYTLEYLVDGYSLGVYNISENRNTLEVGKVIAEELEKINRKYSKQRQIQVIVGGEADGFKPTVNLKYKGEYGNLKFRFTDYNLQKDTLFNKSPGKRIFTNPGLAALRAYSFYNFLSTNSEFFSQNPHKPFFFGRENSQKGAQLRRVWIRIEFLSDGFK